MLACQSLLGIVDLGAIVAELFVALRSSLSPLGPQALRFLERKFKQGLPGIVSNDYPPPVGGLPVQEFPVQGSPV